MSVAVYVHPKMRHAKNTNQHKSRKAEKECRGDESMLRYHNISIVRLRKKENYLYLTGYE